MFIDLKTLTIEKTHKHFVDGDFTVRELCEAYLKNIEAKNKDINAYLEVFSAEGGSASGGDDVLEQADRADKLIKSGQGGSLTGIPFAIKDNILIKGRKVSAASKILEGYLATYDAFVVSKLKEAGAIFLGRTNMDEFAMGSSTENSSFGVTRNPHDLSRVAGGSSGGSAAALAADMALACLGSDTGGSVRQPAAFCGVVGLKPTYGAVSRSGLIAMGSSLDVIGSFTKTVRDAQIIFEAISGYDPTDSTSVPENIRYEYRQRQASSIQYPVSVRDKDTDADNGLTIGVPRDFLSASGGKGISKETLDNFENSLKKLEDAGHKITDIELPLAKYSLPVYYILMPAEASTNLARYDGVRYGLRKEGENLLETYKKTRGEGFGREVRRRIMLGTYVLSHGYYDAYYDKAKQLRYQIENDFSKAFEKVDVIAMPTSPHPAFKIGEKARDPLEMYLSDIFTVSANIAGIPAISIPAGKNKDGLPLDFQLLAPHFREDILFDIGQQFELLATSYQLLTTNY